MANLREDVEALAEAYAGDWYHFSIKGHDVSASLRQILDRHPAADGVVAPISATLDQSSGLARDIVFWWGASNKHGSALHEHLRMCGTPVPTWLHSEIPNEPHTPPKGAVAAAIYRAMVEQHQADAILSNAGIERTETKP